jgi:hypothetical protein
MQKFTLKTPLPKNMVKRMEELKKFISNYDRIGSDPLYKKIRAFYESINEQKYWETILLCLLYWDGRFDENKTALFEKSFKEASYLIPIVRMGRDPEFEAANMLDCFGGLSIDTKKLIALALNVIFEEAVGKGIEPAVMQMLTWSGSDLRHALDHKKIEAVITSDAFSKDTKWYAYGRIAEETSFQETIPVERLRELCKIGALPLSSFFGACTERNDSCENVFYHQLGFFAKAKDSDFDEEDANASSLKDWFRDFICNEGMNANFGGIQSGIGVVSAIYKKCCPLAKGIIQEALEEIRSQKMVSDKDETRVVHSLGFLRKFDDAEKKLFDALIAKKK